MVATLLTGIIAFAATNIDDIVILTLFFSQGQRRRMIVLGQYLGFTALILISLAGFFGGRVLPHEWIRFLGMIPIAIGLKKLLAKNEHNSTRRGRGLWNIAVVTFANGGDNIGVYTPLFAVSDTRQLVELLAVFYVLISVWCFVGALIPRHPLIARGLKRGTHWIAPLVLIGLGIYILSK